MKGKLHAKLMLHYAWDFIVMRKQCFSMRYYFKHVSNIPSLTTRYSELELVIVLWYVVAAEAVVVF